MQYLVWGIGTWCLINFLMGAAVMLFQGKVLTSENLREIHRNVALYLIAAAICFK